MRSRMLDSLLDQFGENALFALKPRANERRSAASAREWDDRSFDVAEGHAFRLHANAAGWRSLAGGQAVDLIVHDDVEQVHIAAH